MDSTVRPSQVTAVPTVPDDKASLCDCDISKSWNDIMILADASSAMGLDRFHEVSLLQLLNSTFNLNLLYCLKLFSLLLQERKFSALGAEPLESSSA